MKKINVHVPVAGANFSYGPGEHMAEDEVAKDLVRAGHAEYADGTDSGDVGTEKTDADEADTKSGKKKTSETAKAPEGEKAAKE